MSSDSAGDPDLPVSLVPGHSDLLPSQAFPHLLVSLLLTPVFPEASVGVS